jgi:hypothetical protein
MSQIIRKLGKTNKERLTGLALSRIEEQIQSDGEQLCGLRKMSPADGSDFLIS